MTVMELMAALTKCEPDAKVLVNIKTSEDSGMTISPELVLKVEENAVIACEVSTNGLYVGGVYSW